MQSLLILRLSALGDVIHTMPAVVALAGTLRPRARLGWVVEEPFAELVETVAPVDAVFRVATRRWRREPFSGSTRADLATLRRELRSFSAGETAVDFQGLVKSALIGVAAGAKQRFGLEGGSVRERLATFLYSTRVRIDPESHVVEWNLALARAAGAEVSNVPKPDYTRFAADPDGSLQQFGGSILLIPGAGRREKQWNIARFASLAERLTKLLGTKPVVVWGPGERQPAEAMAAGGMATIAPATDLRQLAFLLRHARLVIAGDTGPLHLADALGCRVVGLYGPTNPCRNGPYNQPDRCVESDSTTRAMDSISVDAVWNKVQEVLA